MAHLHLPHAELMSQAIHLARLGLYSTTPNPRVGCIITKQGKIIGRGWHRAAGEPHAEVHALRMAGTEAEGADVYVTLEPCSHTGRTPPCAKALIDARVANVTIGMQDPNPLVAGRGISMLKQAGINVSVLEENNEVLSLNPGFCKRMQSGLPRVELKLASSLDGRTAMQSGESQWITGAAARREVQRMRARSCAVLTGIGSILFDDSRLNVRWDETHLDQQTAGFGRQPLRVIVDSNLSLPKNARILQQTGRTLVFYCNPDCASTADELRAIGAEVVRLPSNQKHVDLTAALRYLGEKEQCNEILLECGATLAGAMLKADLVDEITIFMAAKIMGSSARPLFELPLNHMSDALQLSVTNITAIGDDWRITAQPRRS